MVVEHPRVAEEAARVLPLPVAAGDGDVDRQIAGIEAGVAIELVEVDDRGDHAPETPTLVRSVDEDGQPGDEAAAALDEIDRTGEHRRRRCRGRAAPPSRWSALLPRVEADRLFVALERALVGDDETGRDGDIAQQIVRAQHMVAQHVEARPVEVGLAGDIGHEAAHELDLAPDVAFQPILDQVEFGERLGPGAGERELLLLPVGDDAEEDRDHGGDRRRRESRAAQPIEERARVQETISSRIAEGTRRRRNDYAEGA